MAAEVAPEVQAKEAAEGAKKEAERQRLAAELAVSTCRALFCGVLPPTGPNWASMHHGDCESQIV